jgi:hypothetical protein
MGIELTRQLASVGAALVTGYSSCIHTRASNVFANLEQEVNGIALNEQYWAGGEMPEWFDYYRNCRERWQSFVGEIL